MLYARYIVWVWVKEEKDTGLTEDEADALLDKNLDETTEEIQKLSRYMDHEFEGTEVY